MSDHKHYPGYVPQRPLRPHHAAPLAPGLPDCDRDPGCPDCGAFFFHDDDCPTPDERCACAAERRPDPRPATASDPREDRHGMTDCDAYGVACCEFWPEGHTIDCRRVPRWPR